MTLPSADNSELEIKHKVLLRQLRRAKIVTDAGPVSKEQWGAFLRFVESAYSEHDQQDYLVTRAEQLAVNELKVANELLQRERELLTENVRQRSKELENARRIAGIGTFRYDCTDDFFELSNELLDSLGLPSSNDMVWCNDFLDLVEIDDHGVLNSAVNEALSNTDSTKDFELRLRAADGSDRYFLCWLSASSNTTDRSKSVVYGTAIDLTERKKSDEQIRQLAMNDQLTGLQNRQAFKVNARNYFDKPFALLFIDLDGFKEINDSLGHAAGDLLLKEIASRLRAIKHEQISLARFGGDEFLVLIPFQRSNFDVCAITREILTQIAKPLLIAESEVVVSGSIGVSRYPSDGESVEQLIQYADAAMYAAKAAGRNQYCFYQKHMSVDVTSRLDMVRKLRAAIKNNALCVHFQPIVNGQTESILGVEALSRWTDPDLGPISPATFIPLAEQCGLIEDLTDFVLEKTLALIQETKEFSNTHLYASINISPIQFRNPTFVAKIIKKLDDAKVNPNCIQIEITEGAVIGDPQQASAVLKTLRDAGLRVALDDFGTGYSSLAYLQKFSIDSLKIDKSFVNDILTADADVPLVKAIIAIAKSLRMGIVAEGVETQEHRVALTRLGCQVMQGYLFHKPMPHLQLLKVLKEQIQRHHQRVIDLVR